MVLLGLEEGLNVVGYRHDGSVVLDLDIVALVVDLDVQALNDLEDELALRPLGPVRRRPSAAVRLGADAPSWGEQLPRWEWRPSAAAQLAG